MLERLTALGAERAERRPARLAGELAERAAEALPAGIGAEAVPGGVRLTGKRLRARLLFDPALRWIWTRLL